MTKDTKVKKHTRDFGDELLPHALLTDAVYFFLKAKEAQETQNYELTERLLRASVNAAFSFLEALINGMSFYLIDTKSEMMNSLERDVLGEKETKINVRGECEIKDRIYPMHVRLNLLRRILGGCGYDASNEPWQSFLKAQKTRDKWAHPKPPFQPWDLTVKKVEVIICTVQKIVSDLYQSANRRVPIWIVNYEKLAEEELEAELRRKLEEYDEWYTERIIEDVKNEDA